MKKLPITLIAILIFICGACSDSGNNPIHKTEPEDSPVFWGKYYFFNKNMDYWKMKNTKGDTAYFQALDNDTISLAMNCWSIGSSRINVLATPIQFVYWEDGMKKRQYFAIVKHNNTLCFATKKHPMIADYNLDFYVYLFKIPTEELDPSYSYKEVDSDTLLVQYEEKPWIRSYNVEWKHIKTWQSDAEYKMYSVEYTAFNSWRVPQTYTETFGFVKGFGFYTYMDYKLERLDF